MVFVGTLAGKIHCIQIENGEILWSTGLPKPIFGGICRILEEEKLLVPCVDGKVYCLNGIDAQIVN